MVDDRTQRLWAKQVTMLRESSARLATGSGLASTVDEKWRSSTVLHAGGNGFFILPIGGHLNQGSCLWVRKTRAGWSFELTSKTATAPPTTLRRSRATVERAPVVLDKVLAAWLLSYTAAPRPKSPKAALDSWDGVIERMRRTSENDTAKADLLGSVSPEWMDRCYPRDSGWTFSILRVGDHSWIGLGVWIDLTEHGWLLSLERRDISTVRRSDAPAFVAGRRAEGSTEGTTVLEQVSTTRADAGASLNRLLEVMLASEPLVAGEAATETAQESFRRLLREHVAPALRRDGFRGSGNEYRRTAGEYEIGIRFQKSRWSTKDAVDYAVHASVLHPATIARFNEANREAVALGREFEPPPAGAWHAMLSHLEETSGYWTHLRASASLDDHSGDLLERIRRRIYPAVEEQLELPLVAPTPPSERSERPDRETIHRETLARHLALRRKVETGGSQAPQPRGGDPQTPE